jgi:hypothetical protein
MQKRPTSRPTQHSDNYYQLVIPMTGTVGQAQDFAREVAFEFGCEVEIKETTPSGMVVRTIPQCDEPEESNE